MAYAREIFQKLKIQIDFNRAEKETHSHYTIINDILVRVSNHCTYMYVWDNFLEQNPNLKGKKIISIVFEDRDNTFSDECLVLKRYRRNPIVVNEYVFPIHGDGQYINVKDVKNIIANIKRINETELYIDSTGKSTYIKCVSINSSSQEDSSTLKTDNTNYGNNEDEVSENKEYNKINMKKTIRLTESDLRHIISESVRDYLTELDWKTYANAADKASERGQMYYWGDKGEDDLNSFKKAVKNRVRAKRFGDAAKNAFNRDYGYENGHYTDDDYRSVEMKGDFDVTEEFGPHVKGYNGNFKNCLGDIRPLSKYSDITPEEYFDGDEEAAQSYRNARSEFDKYHRNDYKYLSKEKVGNNAQFILQ